jgi:hypothetical protein
MSPSGSSSRSSPRCRFSSRQSSSSMRIASCGSTRRVDRASAWRRRIVVATLVFFAGGVAILIAVTREPGDGLTCAGQCGARGEPTAGEASIILPNGSQPAVVGSESARALAAGRALFQERGCARLSPTRRDWRPPNAARSVRQSVQALAARRKAFRALHERGCFVIPNPGMWAPRDTFSTWDSRPWRRPAPALRSRMGCPTQATMLSPLAIGALLTSQASRLQSTFR